MICMQISVSVSVHPHKPLFLTYRADGVDVEICAEIDLEKSAEKKTDYDVFLCDSCLSVALSWTKHSGIRTHELVEKYFIKQ